MNIVINIDEDIFTDIKEVDFNSARNIVRNYQATIADAIRNGTPIPDNATNGDVMEIMFPNYKFSNNFGWIDTVLNGRSYSFCPVEFWNSPYKRGSENGNN